MASLNLVCHEQQPSLSSPRNHARTTKPLLLLLLPSPFISRPPFLFPLINPTRLLSLIYLLLSKPPARDVAGHRAMTGQRRTRQKIERSRAVSLRTAGRYVIDDDSIIGEQTSVSRPV